ncbi:hypothetical protein HMPREF3231_01638 [Bifidobacterium longum]|nr:hypothetical protein HMPREF3231_01638 [Bifidobacterium longum]
MRSPGRLSARQARNLLAAWIAGGCACGAAMPANARGMCEGCQQGRDFPKNLKESTVR